MSKLSKDVVLPWKKGKEDKKEEEEEAFQPVEPEEEPEEELENLELLENGPEQEPDPEPIMEMIESAEDSVAEKNGSIFKEFFGTLKSIFGLKDDEMTRAQKAFFVSIRKLVGEAITIFNERQKEYGDSWYDLKAEEIAGIMHLKLQRLRKLAGKQASKDSIIDLIVYAAFYKVKMKEAGKW